MMFPKLALSGLILVLTYNLIGSISALRIEVDPIEYTEKSSGATNVSCFLDGDGDVQDVYLMEIMRNGGNPMVFVRQNGISFGANFQNTSKFQAEGQINGSESYLKLSIFDVNEADEGQYTCKLAYSGATGQMSEKESSRNFTVNILDLNDVVRVLQDSLLSLQEKLERQTEKVSVLLTEIENSTTSTRKIVDDLAKTVDDNIGDLKNETGDLKRKTDDLEDDNKSLKNKTRTLEDKTDRLDHETEDLRNKTEDLENKTDDLENATRRLHWEAEILRDDLTSISDKVLYKSAFSATLNQAITGLSIGKVFVFGNVIMRNGPGYDEKTGIFTAPRDGMYIFHLVMTHLDKGTGVVYLKANDKDIAFLRLDRDSYEEQSSVTSVVELTKGDKVTAVARDTTNWWGGLRSMFTGYMIKAY